MDFQPDVAHELDELIKKVKSYLPDLDEKRLKEAFNFAKLAHEGQLRKSGENYIIHPLRTAEILLKLHVDEETLVAAFLHDVPEDTPYTIHEIERRFGKRIAYLVDGITKLAKVHYRHNMAERQVESLKKLFIHTAKDLRVILIKLADRLHNMRTLHYVADAQKRNRIARETLEIYVPISNLLGIGELRGELEDLCFMHLYPDEYTKIKQEVEENMEERNFILDEMIHLTERELKKNKIDAEVLGRPKTFFSIFKKLQIKKSLYNIDDIIAVRVIVPTRIECYGVLGIIHKLFKPKTGHMKDYIAVPKPNGYQSLHTTVFGVNASTVEFQIRTRYMHLEAEYGVAAHYFYKYSDERELTSLMRQRSSWVQRILELQKENKEDTSFLENLKIDIFQDRIFTFTPKGEVIDLPVGASAIDFAYAIHTEVGNHAMKGEINGVLYPLTTPLNTGDTVHIISQRDRKPDREWLSHVKTHLAYTKIREQLKREPPEVKLQTGKKFLQKEFDRIGKNFVEELTTKKIRMLSKTLPYKTLDDILMAIGEGALHPRDILERIYEKEELSPGRKLFFRHKPRRKDFLSSIKLYIYGDNSKGQFREILRTLHWLHIPVVKFEISRSLVAKDNLCKINCLVRNYEEMSQVFESLDQIEGVRKVMRYFVIRKVIFFISSFVTVALWLLHPALIAFTSKRGLLEGSLPSLLQYAGISMLFLLVFWLKRLARRSFPELEETRYFWPLLYGLTTVAFVTVLAETVLLHLTFNWVFVIGLIFLVYALLTVEFVRYRREQFE